MTDTPEPNEDDCLEALLLEGLASKTIPLDAEFRQRLEAKTEAIIAQQGARRDRNS